MRKLPFEYSILKCEKELDWIRWVFCQFVYWTPTIASTLNTLYPDSAGLTPLQFEPVTYLFLDFMKSPFFFFFYLGASCLF